MFKRFKIARQRYVRKCTTLSNITTVEWNSASLYRYDVNCNGIVY